MKCSFREYLLPHAGPGNKITLHLWQGEAGGLETPDVFSNSSIRIIRAFRGGAGRNERSNESF